MKYGIPVFASVLTALLMALPLAGVMEYAKWKTAPRRAELTDSGVRSNLDAFMKEHGLSNNDMRFMNYHKPMSFLSTWLSSSISIGLTVGVFWLFRGILSLLITKQKSPNRPMHDTAFRRP